jgi:molybdopterin synthase sulfur carrier subunit
MEQCPGEPAIRIRLFAGLREAAGWAERTWPAPLATSETLTPQQLWTALELPGDLAGVRIAVNQCFANANTPLRPGDELGFLPPISGG